MIEWIQQTEGNWQYIGLFILSILPLLDVFYIIPVGVAIGLNPFAVGIISFAGNFLMVVVFAAFYQQINEWLVRRKKKKHPDRIEPSKREKRAERIWYKYGLPIFALVAPGVLGTDLAALMALLFGKSKTQVVTWLGISLVIWTVVTTLLVVYGFEQINLI